MAGVDGYSQSVSRVSTKWVLLKWVDGEGRSVGRVNPPEHCAFTNWWDCWLSDRHVWMWMGVHYIWSCVFSLALLLCTVSMCVGDVNSGAVPVPIHTNNVQR